MDQCDPCVTVRLERRSFSFRRGRQRDILAHAVSPTVFRSRHPLFQYIVGLPLQAHMLKVRNPSYDSLYHSLVGTARSPNVAVR